MNERVLVSVTDSPIGMEVAASLASLSDGALVSFLGVVRDSSESKEVVGLDYEAWDEMAEKEMRRLAEEALERWQIGSVAIVHRTGRLDVGEVSVVIAVSAPHREQAFDACRWIIDTLKQTVPMWKKELFADGTSSWVDHP